MQYCTTINMYDIPFIMTVVVFSVHSNSNIENLIIVFDPSVT